MKTIMGLTTRNKMHRTHLTLGLPEEVLDRLREGGQVTFPAEASDFPFPADITLTAAEKQDTLRAEVARIGALQVASERAALVAEQKQATTAILSTASDYLDAAAAHLQGVGETETVEELITIRQRVDVLIRRLGQQPKPSARRIIVP